MRKVVCGAAGALLALGAPALSGCQGSFSANFGQANGAPRAPTPPGSKSTCDLHQVDWLNFTYPDKTVLKNGENESDPNAPERLDAPEIVYGDVLGDKSVQAFVPVHHLAGDSDRVTIYAFGMGPQCRLRALGDVSGLSANNERVVNGALLFDRTKSDFATFERVEARFANGRLVERGACPIAPPPAATPPSASPKAAEDAMTNEQKTAMEAARHAINSSKRHDACAAGATKIDWKNARYPGSPLTRGAFTLRRGTARNGEGDPGDDNPDTFHSSDMQLTGVAYGSIADDGSTQALVTIDVTGSGRGASSGTEVYVCVADPTCHPKCLGTVDSGGAVRGDAYVVNNRSWRISHGALTDR